jgi:hypothetical protein
MRLVAVADTHLYVGRLTIPDGDVLIHAGDMCRFGKLSELGSAVAWMRALPHRVKIVVAGNHDWPFENGPENARAVLGADFIYLQDEGAEIEGLRFWGSPWQPELNDWAFNLPRGAPLAAKWAAIPRDPDVSICSHASPT